MINLNDVAEIPLNDLAKDHLNLILSDIDSEGESKILKALIELQENYEDHSLESDFIEFILGNNFETFFKIISGNVHQLEQIIDDYGRLFGYDFLYSLRGELPTLNNLGVEIREIFNYEVYRGSDFCFGSFLNLLYTDSRPCPYCNIENIEVIDLRIANNDPEDFQLALLDLDHFYPRSRYPFLGLSFYNLIPSCMKCNQRFKKSKNFRNATHINPYDKAFDDHFFVKPNTPIIPFDSKREFHLIFETRLGGNSDFYNSIEDLGLQQRLSTKKKVFQDFIDDLKRFNNGNNNGSSLFNDTNSPSFTLGDLLRIYGITTDQLDIHNTAMSKYLRDIYSKL